MDIELNIGDKVTQKRTGYKGTVKKIVGRDVLVDFDITFNAGNSVVWVKVGGLALLEQAA